MKKIPSITLNQLEKVFDNWRATRKATNQPVPLDLQKMVADALYHFSPKEIMTATRLIKKRLISFRDEFAPGLELKEGGGHKTLEAQPHPVVHLSEFKVAAPSVPHEQGCSKSSILIASIADQYGRSLNIFSGATSPSSLIESFLNSESGVFQ